MSDIDEIVLSVINEVVLPRNKVVYPKMVQPHLPFYRAEQTLRKDFRRLQEMGRLHRIGGSRARRGYLTPEFLRTRKQVRYPVGA